MTSGAPLRIIAVAALSILALVGLVLRENGARAAGREVVMTIQAVDPRDALTGHYVAIDINERAQPGRPCPNSASKQDWLALSPAAGRWHVTGAGATRDEAHKLGEIAVRGQASCSPDWRQALDNAEQAPNQRINADLGISRFHIDQAEAERIEKVLRDRRDDEQVAAAILSIGRDGKARLKGIEMEGRRLMLSLY